MQGLLHKTLIIRLSSVGDIVLSSLLVRTLRKRFPQTQIDYCTKSEYAELVQHNPHLSRVLELQAGATFADLRAMRKRIHAAGYDLIIDIHDSLRSRYLTFAGPKVVRVNKRKIARFLLVKGKINLYAFLGGAPSVAERYLETVRRLGVQDDGGGLELFINDLDRQEAKGLLQTSGLDGAQILIGIAPSARHLNKMWPKERFAEMAIGLSDRHHTAFVLFGSAEDFERCRDIEDLLLKSIPQGSVLNLAGSLSLTQTAAVMDHCAVVITNDSGLMHIAASRKRNLVAIFGPTVRELGFFPFGTRSVVLEHDHLRCRPCTHIGLSYCPKGHFKCMLEIPASQAIESVTSLLST